MRERRSQLLPGGLCAAAAMVALAGCGGRERTAPTADQKEARFGQPALVELDLSRGLPEQASSSLLGSPVRRTHIELVRSLQALADTETTKGILVRLGTTRIALARAAEVGRLLGEVRKAGRPIVCHADEYNNGSLLLAASGCSSLWVSPAGQVDTVGIAAQLVFAKGLLDKLNVDVDFLQVGKFKGASEPFTREGASPEARQSLEGALGGLRAAWLTGIADGRGKQELRDAVEDGPYAPEEAKAKGLVDEIGVLDEAREAAKKLAGVEASVTRFGGRERDSGVSGDLVDIFRAVSGGSAGGTPHVTVVPAIGSISMASGGLPLQSSDGISERQLGPVIARLTKDESTKAVVLRIDSPGGSALASDLLWKRLMKLRQEKPLVVSVGGMAASGGYYMACAGTKILAEPTSIVGSIGVVGGKLAVGKALAGLGVNAETIAANPDPKRANRAAYMSALTSWDDATRERVQSTMEAVYDLFLKRIEEGRGMTREALTPSAEGRIFGGAEAKERGLVDQLGGFQDALKLALSLAKLPDDAPVEVEEDDGGLLGLLGAGVDAKGGQAEARSAVSEEALATRARRAAAGALLPQWLSASPELAALAGSAAPLLAGERTLAALPFAVVIQ